MYPSIALREWGLPSKGYKRKENADQRKTMIELLLEKAGGWFALDSHDAELCIASDDALDAVVAAFVARAAAKGLVWKIPKESRKAARREGWIAVPKPDSLGALA